MFHMAIRSTSPSRSTAIRSRQVLQAATAELPWRDLNYSALMRVVRRLLATRIHERLVS
jgi:hypothetical protein